MAAFDLRLETTHATLHREDGFSEERRSQCWGGRAEPGPARAAGGAVRCAASASPAAQRNPCPLREVVSDPPESLTGSLRGRAAPRLDVCPEERKAGSAGVCRTASTAGQMSPGWPLADHDTGRSAGEPSHGACWHVGEPCTRAQGITRARKETCCMGPGGFAWAGGGTGPHGRGAGPWCFHSGGAEFPLGRENSGDGAW